MDTSPTFTVTLPNYKNFRQTFDLQKFTTMFPDSVITRTLDLTHESDVPIENKQVDPAILEILDYILTTGDYPYVYDPSTKKALDYLGIDLPEYVYDPKYEQVRIDHPNAGPDLFNAGDLDANYEELLRKAVAYDFAPYARYVIGHTDQKMHTQDNTNFVLGESYNPIYSETVEEILVESYNPIYSETVEEILVELVDNLVMGDGEIQQYLDRVSVRGYTQFLSLLLNKLGPNYSPNSEHIQTLIDQSIPNDPEHYAAYARMINYLENYIPEPPENSDYEDEYEEEPEDEYREIRDLYNVFRYITQGHTVPDYEYLGSHFYGLLWVAALSGQGESFNDVLTNIPLSSVYQVSDFLMKYVGHPELIKPEYLTLVGRALRNSLDYTTLIDAANILEEAGYLHLAEIIRAYGPRTVPTY